MTSDDLKILEIVKRHWQKRKNVWQYEFDLPAPIYANDINNDLYAKDITMNCNHEWLVPSDKRTRCKRCGDDGWVSYDGKVHETYEACMNHDALSYGASPLSLPQKLESKSSNEKVFKVSEGGHYRIGDQTVYLDAGGTFKLSPNYKSLCEDLGKSIDKLESVVKDLEAKLDLCENENVHCVKTIQKLEAKLKLATDALAYIADYNTKPYSLSTDPDQSQKARETLAKVKR